ncbi:hypothetical protein O3P69_009616 [Scylla paramamosain]|uniref:Uncharacterized protein n=1 Tax=Scylla paramamosain TaxID=85552 RepID=A0AAW0SWC1_SCYPA
MGVSTCNLTREGACWVGGEEVGSLDERTNRYTHATSLPHARTPAHCQGVPVPHAHRNTRLRLQERHSRPPTSSPRLAAHLTHAAHAVHPPRRATDKGGDK